MPFGIHIDLMELALKGILIGIIASAPMGPVGVLTIQRTMNKGRWYGMVTGLGAAVSDLIYALITGLGMSFVMDLITSPQNKFWLPAAWQSHAACFWSVVLPCRPYEKDSSQRKAKGDTCAEWHNGLSCHVLQPVDNLAVHGMLRPVCLRCPQPSGGDDVWLHVRVCRCLTVVVWAYVAH